LVKGCCGFILIFLGWGTQCEVRCYFIFFSFCQKLTIFGSTFNSKKLTPHLNHVLITFTEWQSQGPKKTRLTIQRESDIVY